MSFQKNRRLAEVYVFKKLIAYTTRKTSIPANECKWEELYLFFLKIYGVKKHYVIKDCNTFGSFTMSFQFRIECFVH